MWSCESREEYDGNCYYHDQKDFMVYAGPYCGNGTFYCYLSDYYDDLNSTACQEQQGRQLLTQWLESKYCTDFKFTEYIGCYKYCEWSSKYLDKWGCDYAKWQADQKQNANGTKLDGKCNQDSQCASKKCDCVINPNDNYGSCTASAYDKITRDFFDYVCGDEDDNYQDKSKREEKSCAYYILVKISHLINSIEQNSDQLDCLKDFNDYH